MARAAAKVMAATAVKVDDETDLQVAAKTTKVAERAPKVANSSAKISHVHSERCYSFWSHGVPVIDIAAHVKNPGGSFGASGSSGRDCSPKRHQTGDERCVIVSA
jgi:hypothetical protein